VSRNIEQSDQNYEGIYCIHLKGKIYVVYTYCSFVVDPSTVTVNTVTVFGEGMPCNALHTSEQPTITSVIIY
jgi:hypothetical protein